MCAIDFDYELGEAMGGNTIYPSEENLRKNHPFVDKCGVAEVITMSKADFNELVIKAGIDPQTIRSSNIGPVIWTKEQIVLEK